MSVWTLLKNFVKDVEFGANLRFDDMAWGRVKKLEADILSLTWEEHKPTLDAYNEQRAKLVAAEAALKPFADYLEQYGRAEPDGVFLAFGDWLQELNDVQLETDFRRASKTYEALKTTT